ncbi:MAG: hypothetical protein WCT18_04245, partial [Patescibacteria group bacterium]
MLQLSLQKIKKFDWLLTGAFFLLFLLGLSAIYSVGLNQEFAGSSNFEKQVFFALLGVGCFFFLGV